MPTCSHCRRQVSDDCEACPHCGTRVDSGPTLTVTQGRGQYIGRIMAAVITGRWSILRPGTTAEFVGVHLIAGMAGLAGSWLGILIAYLWQRLFGFSDFDTLSSWLSVAGSLLGFGLIEYLWLAGHIKVRVISPDETASNDEAESRQNPRADHLSD